MTASTNNLIAFLKSRGHNAVLKDLYIDLFEQGKNEKDQYGYGSLFLEDLSDSKISNNYRWTYMNNDTGLVISSDLNPDAPCEKVCDFLAQEDAPLLQYRQNKSGE